MPEGALPNVPSAPVKIADTEHPDDRQRYVESWLNFEKACVSIAQRVIASKIVPQSILGIQRGGLVMAVRISHLLTVPMTDSVRQCVSPCLIVDDISDTGFTLQYVCEELPSHARDYARIATWHRRAGTDVEPDYYYAEAENYHIIYPWEVPTIRRVI